MLFEFFFYILNITKAVAFTVSPIFFLLPLPKCCYFFVRPFVCLKLNVLLKFCTFQTYKKFFQLPLFLFLFNSDYVSVV